MTMDAGMVTLMSPEEIDETFVPVPVTGVEAIPIEGEAVLVAPEGASVHQLNPPAALVWACLDGEATVGELVTDLSEGLGIPLDTMRDDVLALVRQLGTERLLEGVEPEEVEPAGVGPRDDAKPATEADPRFVGDPPND
jgi:hypothetical protein